MIKTRPDYRASGGDPDWLLVVAARQNDEAAIRELVRRMNPRLFRITRGILHSDALAEEAVQEAYLLAFSKLDSFRGEARFSTWISRIAINTARMQARRHHPEVEYDTVNEAQTPSDRILFFPGSESGEAATSRHQLRALLEAAIADLPSDLRLPFLLYEVEGMSTFSISRDLDLNPITVRTRLFRARRQLRQTLSRQMKGGFDEVFPFDGARCAHMADRVITALRARGSQQD